MLFKEQGDGSLAYFSFSVVNLVKKNVVVMSMPQLERNQL